MAVPDSMTTLDMTSVQVLNKTLSDNVDKILSLQGINLFTQKIIARTTVTLYIQHYKDAKGVEHIEIEQLSTSGQNVPERRDLSWVERRSENPLYGHTITKSRRVALEDIHDEFLAEAWDAPENGLIETDTISDTALSGLVWTAVQIWGFAVVDGERRYVRRVRFTGPEGEDLTARIVYDYGKSAVTSTEWF